MVKTDILTEKQEKIAVAMKFCGGYSFVWFFLLNFAHYFS